MFSYILSKVSGTHLEDEVLRVRPSRRFIIGTLASAKEGRHSDSEDEGRASIRARRLKVSFLIDKASIMEHSTLSVRASGYVYYPIQLSQENIRTYTQNVDEETGSEQAEYPTKKSETGWKRLSFSDNFDYELSSIKETIADKIDFSKTILEANKESKVNIDADIWNAEISLERQIYDKQSDLISINFTNTAIEPEKPTKKERSLEYTLFDCKLSVILDNVNAVKFMDEYEYEHHTQRYYYDFRTINCQAYWEIEKKKFGTRHYGEYIQENIGPRQSIANVDLSFHNLSSESSALGSLQNLLKKLDDLSSQYNENYSKEKESKKDDDKFQPIFGNHQQTWQERNDLITQFDELIIRVREGIKEIIRNATTRLCFLKMNETFYKYYSNRGITDGKWRMFQFVFLLAAIPAITSKKGLEIADILHVNTGGGKSEAYFGLIVFAIFHERAEGKKEGVTAIVKFPLRMLSIQQLERISSIIIYAEQVRFNSHRFQWIRIFTWVLCRRE